MTEKPPQPLSLEKVPTREEVVEAIRTNKEENNPEIEKLYSTWQAISRLKFDLENTDLLIEAGELREAIHRFAHLEAQTELDPMSNRLLDLIYYKMYSLELSREDGIYASLERARAHVFTTDIEFAEKKYIEAEGRARALGNDILADEIARERENKIKK